MPTWDTVQRIFLLIEETANGDPLLGELKEELVQAAVTYARIRVDWQLNPPPVDAVEEREARGAHRTSAHNDFIVACNVLARAMQQRGLDASWRAELGEDRRQMGDWACYLHCLLGLRAR